MVGLHNFTQHTKKYGMRKQGKKFLACMLTASLVCGSTEQFGAASITAMAKKQQKEAQYRQELASYEDIYPEGVFSFYKEQYTTKEGEKAITFDVVRLGGTDIADTVMLKAIDVSATYGEDYTVEVETDGTYKSLDTSECSKVNMVDAMFANNQAKMGEPVIKEQESEAKLVTGSSVTTAAENRTSDSETDSKTDSTSALKASKEIQTGVKSDQPGWDETGYDQKALEQLSDYAQNELVHSVKGAKQTIAFAPGEYKKTVRVTVKNDGVAEGDESVMFLLGDAKKTGVSEKVKTTLTIKDNENEDVVFSMKDAEVKANAKGGKAVVYIQRTSGLGYYAAALVSTASDTAKSGEDYQALNSIRILFAEGQETATVEIPLEKTAKDGSTFRVVLMSDDVKVSGQAETLVTIENKGQKKAQAVKKKSVVKKMGDGDVTYQTATWWAPSSGSQYGYGSFDNKETTTTFDLKDWMKGAVRLTTSFRVDGSTDNWLFTSREKEYWVWVGNWNQFANGKTGDHQSCDYNVGTNLDKAKRENGKLIYRSYPKGCNEVSFIQNISATFYYPDYVITFDNSKAKQKGYTYTSENKDVKKNGEDYTIGTYPDNKTATLSNNWWNDSVYIRPSVNWNYGDVDYYELYSGDTKVGTIKGSNWLRYEDMYSILDNYQDTLSKNKFRITVKPIYTLKEKTVQFREQDKNFVSFSGSVKGGTGFKNDSTFTCNAIDKLEVTAQDTNNQEFEVTKMTALESGWWRPYTYDNKNSSKTSMTQTFDQTRDITITCYYKEPTITIGYDFEGQGAIRKNVDNSILSLESISNKTFPLIQVAGGEVKDKDGNFVDHPYPIEVPFYYRGQLLNKDDKDKITAENTKVSMSDTYITKLYNPNDSMQTVWTSYHKDSNGKKMPEMSVIGDSYVFKPWYADTILTYYARPISKSETLFSCEGTVKIKEKLLFSQDSNRKEEVVAAKGAEVFIGGENATVDGEGNYKTDASFQAGTNVSAFVRCGTVAANAVVPVVGAKGGTKADFVLSASEDDPMKIDDSSLVRKVQNKKTKKMESESTSVIYLEDTDYIFRMKVSASAGYTPKYAKFYVLGIKGNRKDNLTQTVEVGLDGTVELVLNPMSVPTVADPKKKESLSEGDSFVVQIFDQKGNGYFEHHAKPIVSQPQSSLYLFNYDGWKSSDDNFFMKALGQVSMGYDFVLNCMTSNLGSYEETVDGESVTRVLTGFGFGSDFANGMTGNEKTKAIYNKEHQILKDIEDGATGNIKPQSYDSLNILGGSENKSNWGLELQIGVIMDNIQIESGENKGKFKLGNFVMYGEAGFTYQKEVNIPIGPLDFLLKLEVNTTNGKDTTGIQWAFTGKGDALSDANSTINLLSGVCTVKKGDGTTEGRKYPVEQKGQIKLIGNFDISAYLGKGTSSKGFIGVGGKIRMELNAYFTHKGKTATSKNMFRENGEFDITPSLMLKASIVEIPLIERKFQFKWDEEQTWGSVKKASIPDLNEILSEQDMLHVSTENAETYSRAYLKNESKWNSGKGFSKRSIQSSGGEQESVLKSGLYSNSQVALQKIGNGNYLAVFTDDDETREPLDRSALYYSIYDGKTWGAPVILDQDGTADDVPVISEAGEDTYLVAWSSADKKLSEDMTTGEKLSCYNIKGAFFSGESKTFGEVMDITKTTEEDNVADLDPQLTYSTTTGGVKCLRVYYKKCEYSIADKEAGEVVGDVVNPYTVIAVREYDYSTKKWKETYDEEAKEKICKQICTDTMTEDEKTAAYNAYEANWYGQEFLGLAPNVNVTETINEDTGYWADGTTAEFSEYTGANDPLVTATAAIGYGDLSMIAYTLDSDGSSDTDSDQNLYLQIYNAKEKSYTYPILVTSARADMSNLQFVRNQDTTYLYWIQDGVIKSMDISYNVKNALKEGTTESGVKYYYFDRSNPDATTAEGEENAEKLTVNGYKREMTIADASVTGDHEMLNHETGEEEEQVQESNIQSYTVRSDGKYIYTIWPQQKSYKDKDDKTVQECQLMAVRQCIDVTEETVEEETVRLYAYEKSNPVQITEKDRVFYMASDYVVNADGTLTGIAARFGQNEGVMDENSGELVAISFDPERPISEAFELEDVSYSDPVMGEEAPQVGVSMKLVNNSVADAENISIIASDSAGNVIFNSADTNENHEAVTISGGGEYHLAFDAPVDSDNHYSFVVAASGAAVAAPGSADEFKKTFTGTVSSKLTGTEFSAETAERNKISVRAKVYNDSVVQAKDEEIVIGYMDAEGKEQPLMTKKIDSLSATDTAVIEDTIIDVDFDTAGVDTIEEDGTHATKIQLYLKTGDEEFTPLYQTVQLTATKDQMDLMKQVEKVEATMNNMTVGNMEQIQVKVNDVNLNEDPEAKYSGLQVIWENDANGVVEVNGGNYVTALKEGSTTLKGYILPVDTTYDLYEGGCGESRSNYNLLPSEAIKEVTCNISVKNKKVTPVAPPIIIPIIPPEVTPEASPEASPEVTPQTSPQVSPEVTPQAEPTVTPETTPQAVPEVTPATTPETAPKATPEVTPKETPKVTPNITPEVTPKETPKATPKVTPTVEPNVTPNVTPAVSATPGKPKKISISKAKIGTIKQQYYTGKKLTPAVKVSYKGKTLKAGKDYKVSYKNNKAIGKAQVTITGMGAYNNTVKKYFKIVVKAPAKVKVKKSVLTFSKSKGAKKYCIYYRQHKKKTWKVLLTTKKIKVKLSSPLLKEGKKYELAVVAKSGKKGYDSSKSKKVTYTK